MNKSIQLLKISCIIIFFCQCSSDTINDGKYNTGELNVSCDECFPNVTDKYQYPFFEREMWTEMDPSERLKLSQLPDQALKTISTLGLISSFLYTPYSLWLSFEASSNSSVIQTSDRVFDMYNSAQALLKRKDAAQALMYYYENICFDCLALSDDDENDEILKTTIFSYRLISLHCLFVRPEILSQTNHKDKQRIVTMLLEDYRQLQKYPSSIIPAMSLIMYEDNYTPIVNYFKNNKSAYDQNGYPDGSQYLDILPFAEDYIKN